MYALKQQREQQNRLLDELFCPITKQILPSSIDDRIKLYEKREELEEQGIAYEIVKERFLNWRLLYGIVKVKKESVISHILPYSKLKSGYSRGKIEKEINGVHYFSRDEIKFITLKHYNKLAKTNYKSVLELVNNPPDFDTELKIREKILNTPYNLSTIIVTQEIPTSKVEIKIDAKVYEDVKEVLIVKQ